MVSKNFKESMFWFQLTRLQTTMLLFVGYIIFNTLKQELNGTKAYKETSTDEKTVVNTHSNDLPYKFAVYIKEHQDKLTTMYWLPKLHKRKLDPLPTLALAIQQNCLNY